MRRHDTDPSCLPTPTSSYILYSYMRRLHHCCKLVHGDLSEYNMLYHRGQLFIIDVSQVALTMFIMKDGLCVFGGITYVNLGVRYTTQNQTRKPQSVEHDHPHALDFLRMDCRNVNDFFRRKVIIINPSSYVWCA